MNTQKEIILAENEVGGVQMLLVRTLYWVLEILKYAIILRAILSWFPMSGENPFIRLLYQVTEPMLAPVRSLLQRSSFGKNMMIDFSSIIVFIIIIVIQNAIIL